MNKVRADLDRMMITIDGKEIKPLREVDFASLEINELIRLAMVAGVALPSFDELDSARTARSPRRGGFAVPCLCKACGKKRSRESNYCQHCGNRGAL